MQEVHKGLHRWRAPAVKGASKATWPWGAAMTWPRAGGVEPRAGACGGTSASSGLPCSKRDIEPGRQGRDGGGETERG